MNLPIYIRRVLFFGVLCAVLIHVARLKNAACFRGVVVSRVFSLVAHSQTLRDGVCAFLDHGPSTLSLALWVDSTKVCIHSWRCVFRFGCSTYNGVRSFMEETACVFVSLVR